MKPKAKRIVHERTSGPRAFTRWIHPKMRGYILVCCGCGLAHEMQFNAVEVLGKTRRDGRFPCRVLDCRRFGVQFRARRSPAYTRRARKESA